MMTNFGHSLAREGCATSRRDRWHLNPPGIVRVATSASVDPSGWLQSREWSVTSPTLAPVLRQTSRRRSMLTLMLTLPTTVAGVVAVPACSMRGKACNSGCISEVPDLALASTCNAICVLMHFLNKNRKCYVIFIIFKNFRLGHILFTFDPGIFTYFERFEILFRTLHCTDCSDIHC